MFLEIKESSKERELRIQNNNVNEFWNAKGTKTTVKCQQTTRPNTQS